MEVITKVLILIYFIFYDLLDSGLSIKTKSNSTDINRFLAVISSFKVSNVAASTLLLNPSNYLQFQSGLKNEDLHLNASQLIIKYGLPVETRRVTTPDGYILTLFRIPCGGPPVFLLHGLLLSADDFIVAGPDSGLAYLLARDGYDVWLGNARGNKYSRMHQTLNPNKDSAFWNFSFSEIGEIDTPTMIDYILHVTGYPKLNFIGYSQGTSAFYVMCSEHPKYNDKVALMISMGVVAFISNLRSPLFRALAYFIDEEYFLYEHLGYPNEIAPSNALTKAISGVVCGVAGLATATVICTNIAFLLFGYDYSLLNITNIPNIAQHAPAGSSTKQIIHYGQEINSGNFQKFDYGEKKNTEVYGSETAPFYNLNRVTAPVVIFYSDNDWVVDVKDAFKTKNQLPNVLEFYRIPYASFNHLDYVWGLHSKTLVYSKISEVLRKYGIYSEIKKCSRN